MIMYFMVIASVPFALTNCKNYLNWYPNSEFYAYGVALYATTVVSLVGWVS